MHFVVKCLDSASQGARGAGRGQSRHCLQVSLCRGSPPQSHWGSFLGMLTEFSPWWCWNRGEVEVLVSSLPLEVTSKGGKGKLAPRTTHTRGVIECLTLPFQQEAAALLCPGFLPALLSKFRYQPVLC